MDADEWDARYRDAELLWTGQANRFVAAELESVAPRRALDLGCEEGRNAIWLAERGWTATLTRQLGGLTVERAERVTREVSTDDGPRTAIDTLVRARRE